MTAGNPLLLRQLLTALASEQSCRDAAHAASVRAIGPRAVSRTVLLRLGRLPPHAGRGARGRGAGRAAGCPRSPGWPGGVRGRAAAEGIDALVRA